MHCVIIFIIFGISSMHNLPLTNKSTVPKKINMISFKADTIIIDNTSCDTVIHTLDESINQQGENNNIEIINTDSSQNTKRTVKINQTGNNNNIKINQH